MSEKSHSKKLLFISYILLLSIMCSCQGSKKGDDPTNDSISSPPLPITELFILRTDSEGNTIWSQIISGMDNCIAISAEETQDGGFIVAGTRIVAHQLANQGFLIKTNDKGAVEWKKTVDGFEYPRSFIQTSDGGFLLAGACYFMMDEQNPFQVKTQAMYLVKMNSEGSQLWSKILESYTSEANFAIETSDNCYVIAGYIQKGPNKSPYLAKTDNVGNTLLSKTYENLMTDGVAKAVQETKDGGFIIVSESPDGIFLIKTDNEGNETWNNASTECTNASDCSDRATAVHETHDGGYIFTGYNSDTIFSEIIKTDSTGNILWSEMNWNRYKSILELENGSLVLAGGIIENRWGQVFDTSLTKMDSECNKIWSKIFAKPGTDIATSVKTTSDNGFIISGTINELNPMQY